MGANPAGTGVPTGVDDGSADVVGDGAGGLVSAVADAEELGSTVGVPVGAGAFVDDEQPVSNPATTPMTALAAPRLPPDPTVVPRWCAPS
jgi:hypothetical protein